MLLREVITKKMRAFPCLGVLLALSFMVSLNTYANQNLHALRSAYLYYFSSLIVWPKNTAFTQNKFELCAVTSDKQDHFQLSTIKNKKSGSHDLQIRLIENLKDEDLRGCHALYVNLDDVGSDLSPVPEKILLITEGAYQFKGDIHLFSNKNKLMFDINVEKLNAKGFRASSKLIRLSRRATQ